MIQERTGIPRVASTPKSPIAIVDDRTTTRPRKEGVAIGISIGVGIRCLALIGLGAKPRRSGRGAVVYP